MKQPRKEWNVLRFRGLIRPFYLRRTKTSKWEGKLIIPKTIRAPVPFVEDPDDDKDINGHYYREALSMSQASQTKPNHKSMTLHAPSNNIEQIKKRANMARMLAWSSVYKDWERIEKSAGGVAQQQQKTLLFRTTFTQRVPSKLIMKLVELLKMIKAKKERFIIVSDRLFLLHAAAQG